MSYCGVKFDYIEIFLGQPGRPGIQHIIPGSIGPPGMPGPIDKSFLDKSNSIFLYDVQDFRGKEGA